MPLWKNLIEFAAGGIISRSELRTFVGIDPARPPDISLLGDLPSIMPICKTAMAYDNVELVNALVAAKARGAGAKEIARILDVPWCARVISEERRSSIMLSVVRALPPSTFAQTYPKDDSRVRQWGLLVERCNHKTWMAHNAVELCEQAGDDGAMSVVDYLNSLPDLAKTKKVSVVIEESEKWHERPFSVLVRLAVDDQVTPAIQRLGEPMQRLSGAMAETAIFPEDFLTVDHPALTGEIRLRVSSQTREDLAREQLQWRNVFYGEGTSRAERGLRDDPNEPPGPVAYPFAAEMPLQFQDYELRMLTTHREFQEESILMDHCIGDPGKRYWKSAVALQSFFATIRKRGQERPVATIEFGRDYEPVQTQGYKNNPPGQTHKLAVNHLCRAFRNMILNGNYETLPPVRDGGSSQGVMLIGGPRHGERISIPPRHNRYTLAERRGPVLARYSEGEDRPVPVDFVERHYRRVSIYGNDYFVLEGMDPREVEVCVRQLQSRHEFERQMYVDYPRSRDYSVSWPDILGSDPRRNSRG